MNAHENDLNITLDTTDDGTMDRDLVEHFRNNLTNDRSKDGIGAGLFPSPPKPRASTPSVSSARSA